MTVLSLVLFIIAAGLFMLDALGCKPWAVIPTRTAAGLAVLTVGLIFQFLATTLPVRFH